MPIPIKPGDNIYTGDLSVLETLDIDTALEDAVTHWHNYYMSCFTATAEKAKSDGDVDKEAAFRFLAGVVSCAENFDTPDQPFMPMFQDASGSRTLLPYDLSESDIEALKILSQRTKRPALQAILDNILWVLKKDHLKCLSAAKAYADSADGLMDEKNWSLAEKGYHGALLLAQKMGRNKPFFIEISSRLENVVVEAYNNDKIPQCFAFMRLQLRFGLGDPVQNAIRASEIAKKALDTRNFWNAQQYYEIEAEWHKRNKDNTSERKARINAAEAIIADADSRMQGPQKSALSASQLLASGIEALRQAKGDRERIDELRSILSGYQKDSLDEMHTFTSDSIDLTDSVAKAAQHVKKNTFWDAITHFVIGYPLLVPKDIRQQVVEIAEQTPLLHLISSFTVDRDGRPIFRKQGILGAAGDDREDAILLEMHAHARQLMSIRAAAYIEPARLQILNDHCPNFSDLGFLVRNNIFVPPGHEGIFLQGLNAGFHGDWVIACHLLVPQLENSLRYVLESNGVDVTNLFSDLTQPVKILGSLLALPETVKIFGEEICFELRTLNEKAGFDFRNRIAHGFVSVMDCYSAEAQNIWWLILRLCVIPIYNHLNVQQKGTNE